VTPWLKQLCVLKVRYFETSAHCTHTHVARVHAKHVQQQEWCRIQNSIA
jgi:hypothetical protein